MKITYSCVVDGKPKFEWQAFLWASSLLRNGGCNPHDLKVHCMPGVSGNFRRALGNLRVPVVDATPFEGGHAYCNKIEQCFSPAFEGYDKIILTDADLFFLTCPQLPLHALFAGKVVDMENPPLEMLRSCYEDARIEPSQTVAVDCALSTREKTFRSNLNGGFYVIDRSILDELGHCWKKHALWLIERIDRLAAYRAHVDQIAMALALDELKIDVAPLTAQTNFPVHLPKERLAVLAAPQIDVLHYHSHVLPNGHIQATAIRSIDSAIDRANNVITEIISDHFDNALFWNHRYVAFPELGSGVGSRGETLEYKRELLAAAVRHFGDKSVLEIGCGDLETSRVLDFQAYVGRDVSAAALEIARTKRPDWKFVPGTIGDSERSDKADLVMCLDVLIHQKRNDEYRELLSGLVDAAEQRLIVSGYEETPSFRSNIVGYHGPLSAALGGFDVFNEILEIGKYRDVSVIVADKRPTGQALHPHDLPVEMFDAMAPLVERRDLLRAIMDASREHLGFFTKTATRSLEYPWMFEKLSQCNYGSRVLDIGAGISPLPPMLSEKGLNVATVDSHPTEKTLADRKTWNEWGFFNYAALSPNAQSFHADILAFQPNVSFDAIYSISVIEHMPRAVWERTLSLTASWLRPGASLLLTLDIIPGTDSLWNMSEGKVVEENGDHGGLKDIVDKLVSLDFDIEECSVRREIPFARTDVAFLSGRLKR